MTIFTLPETLNYWKMISTCKVIFLHCKNYKNKLFVMHGT